MGWLIGTFVAMLWLYDGRYERTINACHKIWQWLFGKRIFRIKEGNFTVWMYKLPRRFRKRYPTKLESFTQTIQNCLRLVQKIDDDQRWLYINIGDVLSGLQQNALAFCQTVREADVFMYGFGYRDEISVTLYTEVVREMEKDLNTIYSRVADLERTLRKFVATNLTFYGPVLHSDEGKALEKYLRVLEGEHDEEKME